MSWKPSFPVILALAASTLLVACDRPQDPILIGATMSETGAWATQGTAARDGYLLCQEHVNREGGLLGRPVEFVILDDESDPELAPALYEELITRVGVDAVMGPYGSTLTEAVAPVTEEHRFVHISPLAATTSIWEQGRRYLFMVLPPAELFLAGLIEMASERDLERVAILAENQLFPRAAAVGARELAEERGMQVVMEGTYPSGLDDFSPFLDEVRGQAAQVLAMAASNLDDFITVTRQMRDMNVNLAMFGTSGAVSQFQEALWEDAEYVYGLSAWEPGLPHPGIDEFVSAYREAFGRMPSFHAAGAYAACRLFMEAATRAETLESDPLRDELLALETTTLLGPWAVDERGYQTANQGVFIQWQDGEKAVVWPEEVATGEPRYPTPAWRER